LLLPLLCTLAGVVEPVPVMSEQALLVALFFVVEHPEIFVELLEGVLGILLGVDCDVLEFLQGVRESALVQNGLAGGLDGQKLGVAHGVLVVRGHVQFIFIAVFTSEQLL